MTTCSKGDTAAAEEVSAVLAAAGANGAMPLHGVMHAGAVLDSKVIANISAASIRAEFAGKQAENFSSCAARSANSNASAKAMHFDSPALMRLPLMPCCAGKVYGAQHLLQLSAQAALSMFQLFSSLAAFSGAAGQASYAAANGTLDAWAHDSQVRSMTLHR